MDLAVGKSGPQSGQGPRKADPGAAHEEHTGVPVNGRRKGSSGGNSGNGRGGSSRRQQRSGSSSAISTLIEGEIIPQLLVAHRMRPGRSVASGGGVITADDVARFSALPLTLQADELLVHVEDYLARGVGIDAIFVDLLAPAARRLGVLWEEDLCDFLDVTIGLWRLQEVMREIAWGSPIITGPLTAPRRAPFSPIPGDQHSFGATMVHEVFVRAAWDSEVLVAPDMRQLVAKVANKSYDLVGLTVSCDVTTDSLARTIKAIRSVSMCQDVSILVGGHAVNANPAMALEAGADGSAVDAPGALALANRLVGAATHRTVNAG
ncbi:cobalamin B12-binding domain-containing protein [Novosphingobium sp.]|uniref:cobalamin B12-binding domain-containing protein n=1 Tax=Novosphingobium sp. TaxID=1874826 RepID=UPI001DB84A6B|nr:cobalamin B12-binding domain-containing protein [Novosphingobium sp.]MBX9665092.1 cobalamin B12-binding domain-containing protein [Novosphingobium sp.]